MPPQLAALQLGWPRRVKKKCDGISLEIKSKTGRISVKITKLGIKCLSETPKAGRIHHGCFHPSTSEMSSLRRHVLQNPDILQQMLEDSTWFARDFAGLEFTLISTFLTKAVLGLKGKIQII